MKKKKKSQSKSQVQVSIYKNKYQSIEGKYYTNGWSTNNTFVDSYPELLTNPLLYQIANDVNESENIQKINININNEYNLTWKKNYIWNTHFREFVTIIHVTKNQFLLIGGWQELSHCGNKEDLLYYTDILVFDYNRCTKIYKYLDNYFMNECYLFPILINNFVWMISNVYSEIYIKIYILDTKTYTISCINDIQGPKNSDFNVHKIVRHKYYPKRNIIFFYISKNNEWTLNTLTFEWEKLSENNKLFNWSKYDIYNDPKKCSRDCICRKFCNHRIY